MKLKNCSERCYVGVQIAAHQLFLLFSSGNSLNIYTIHLGKSVHCWQLKSGFLNLVLLINTLMHMHINYGDLTASFSILHENYALADIAS